MVNYTSAPRVFGTRAASPLVLALDVSGKIIPSLREPAGNHLKEITSAREYGGTLYLGSLHNDRIGKYKLGE